MLLRFRNALPRTSYNRRYVIGPKSFQIKCTQSVLSLPVEAFIDAENFYNDLKILFDEGVAGLDFSGNKIGDEGVRQIYDFIVDSKTLSYLNLSETGLTDRSSFLVASAVMSSPSLVSIDLSRNPINSPEFFNHAATESDTILIACFEGLSPEAKTHMNYRILKVFSMAKRWVKAHQEDHLRMFSLGELNEFYKYHTAIQWALCDNKHVDWPKADGYALRQYALAAQMPHTLNRLLAEKRDYISITGC